MTVSSVYIALGSNAGSRRATLQLALERISQLPGTQLIRVSDFIETTPQGGPAGQGAYLNAVAEVKTAMEPHGLLGALRSIEQELGRNRTSQVRWGPRTCDLDILLVDQRIIDSPDLKVPHPQMHKRRFVLGPLAQISPDAVHPVLKKTAEVLLKELGDET